MTASLTATVHAFIEAHTAQRGSEIVACSSPTLGDWQALSDALSPKEAELVKPPREYGGSGDAVVTCPVCHDASETFCQICSGTGHLTAEEAATWYWVMNGRVPVASHDAARERIARAWKNDVCDAACDAENGKVINFDARWEKSRVRDAILAALPTTDGAGEPTAYRVDWWDGQRPRMRVQLSTVVEPWLHVLKPTFTPLYAATPPTTDASERMREALTEARATFDAMRRGKRVDLTGAVDRCDAALAPSNNEVSGDK